MRCPIKIHADKYPNSIALSTDQEQLTYSELNNLIIQIQNILKSIGLETGDRIGVNKSISFVYIAFLFACFREGFVTCLINNKLPIQNICHQLELVKCSYYWGDQFERIVKDNSQIKRIEDRKLLKESNSTYNLSFLININQNATIIFTSGTAGTPKAIAHTFGNHYYSALGSNENIEISLNDCWLLSLPCYHVSGLSILFRSFIARASILISKIPIWASFENYKVTHISLVQSQLNELLEHKINNPHLKTVLVGGSHIPKKLIAKALAKGLPIFTTYGSSEMSSQICTTKGDNSNKVIENTSGRLLEHRDLKIADDSEILVKGRTLFKGYIDEEFIVLPLDKSNWFQTGDIGKIDENGNIKILGRKDNMFISGGENIYPEEIEKALINLPDILEAKVEFINDNKFGKRPIAYLKTNTILDECAIKAELAKVLEKYKIPDKFLFMD